MIKKYIASFFLLLGIIDGLAQVSKQRYHLDVAEKTLLNDRILATDLWEDIRLSVKNHLDSLRGPQETFVAGMLLYRQDTLFNEEAFRLIAKSANDSVSYANAEVVLGEMYRTGIGTRVNYELAFKHYNNAYQLGNQKATYPLGYFYMKGFGVKQDYQKALFYLDQSTSINAQYWADYIRFHDFVDQDQSSVSDSTFLRLERPELFMGRLPDFEIVPEEEFIDFTKITRLELIGSILETDWSGRYVFQEHEINTELNLKNLILEIEGEQVEFLIQDQLNFDGPIPIQGQVELPFDHFNQYIQELRTIRFYKVRFNNTLGILGAVRTFNSELNEPGPPLYILLKIGDVQFKPLKKEEVFQVFPNPFRDHLTFLQKVNSVPTKIMVKVYDFNGALKKAFHLNPMPQGEIRDLNLSNLKKGKYILEVTIGGQRYSEILLKH